MTWSTLHWYGLVAFALVVSAPSIAIAQVDGVVPVATRDLARGTVLTAEDFRLGDAAETASEGPLGWITRRVVSEGEPLEPPTIAPAPVVQPGDPVQLVWRDGLLELRMSGKAMSSGAIGESVRVRIDTRRRYEGTVLEAGVVRLDSPENGRTR